MSERLWGKPVVYHDDDKRADKTKPMSATTSDFVYPLIPPWKVFFTDHINAAPFVPYDLDFDRDNPEMQAHLSRKACIDFYSGNGGAEFWSTLSMRLQPKVIVEIGTAFGIRTNLIGKLNPTAEFYSSDTLYPYPLNDDRVETGYIARMNNVPFTFIADFIWGVNLFRKVNLCFIDGDHHEECVCKDTDWAWRNHDPTNFAIVWDDYALPGVKTAVYGLCDRHRLTLNLWKSYAWVGSQDWLA